MASAGSIKVNVADAARRTTLTVRVHGVQSFRFKLWVAYRMLWLVARVIGCKYKFVDQEEPV